MTMLSILFLKYVYVVEIAGQAVEVEAKSYDEFLGDAETYVVGFDGPHERLGLEEQGGDLDFGRVLALERVDEIVDGMARVDDVLHDDHGAAADVIGESEHFLHDSGRAGAFVALDADKRNLGIDALAGAEEVGSKRKSPVEYTHKQGLFVGAIAHNLLTQLLDAGVDSLSEDIRLEGEAFVGDLFHPNK